MESFQFIFNKDTNFGVSRDFKKFCVLSSSGVVIYDDLDSALAEFKKFISSLSKSTKND